MDIGAYSDSLATDAPLLIEWNRNDIIHYVGELDDLSIWSRALSRREIRRLMYQPPEDNAEALVAYWPFDAIENGVVIDRGPNGFHDIARGASLLAASSPTYPPWTETWSFYVLCGLLGFGGLFGGRPGGMVTGEQLLRECVCIYCKCHLQSVHYDQAGSCKAAPGCRPSDAGCRRPGLLLEDGLKARAVEAKSGATIASDFFSHLESLRDRIPHELPHMELERRIVYGGERSETRHGTEVLPWRRVQDVEW